jgi:hypothetical protein
VRASSRFGPGAVAVVHRDDANRFASGAHASFLVVVRADRAPVVACDFALAQNALALASKERFLPLWPQPGLRPRDAARGCGVKRIAYVGRTGSAPAWFADRDFLRALRFRGIEFEVRRAGWDDYSGIDVALAARVDTLAQLRTKPATKLYNAWLAGVPMIAFPEPAYAELRRSPLDFIEAAGPRDVLAALDLLRANPRLYAAMAHNGRMRGSEFGVPAVRARWLEFLEGEVARAFEAARPRLTGRRGWYLSAMAAQKARSRCIGCGWATSAGGMPGRCGRPAARSGCRYSSARPTTSATFADRSPASRIASSAARACAWRPVSYFFQRSNERARRAATCGLMRSSSTTRSATQR